LVQASFEGLVGIDDGLREGDGLKARFDFKVEIEVSVAGWMVPSG
jgi:hypothetical protein